MMFAFLVVVLAMPQAGPPQPAPADLGWLSGCWALTRGGRHIVEQWTSPEGGTLLGMSRTVVDGRTSEYEFMLIRRGATALEYVAKPSGQPEAIFTSTRVTATEVVFENPAHDFPKRILYTRRGEELLAAIEGPVKGETRRVEFPYAKAACGR